MFKSVLLIIALLVSVNCYGMVGVTFPGEHGEDHARGRSDSVRSNGSISPESRRDKMREINTSLKNHDLTELERCKLELERGILLNAFLCIKNGLSPKLVENFLDARKKAEAEHLLAEITAGMNGVYHAIYSGPLKKILESKNSKKFITAYTKQINAAPIGSSELSNKIASLTRVFAELRISLVIEQED